MQKASGDGQREGQEREGGDLVLLRRQSCTALSCFAREWEEAERMGSGVKGDMVVAPPGHHIVGRSRLGVRSPPCQTPGDCLRTAADVGVTGGGELARTNWEIRLQEQVRGGFWEHTRENMRFLPRPLQQAGPLLSLASAQCQ